MDDWLIDAWLFDPPEPPDSYWEDEPDDDDDDDEDESEAASCA